MFGKFGSRRGSALLIVLGMLSFMVVSAVGFSVYMRQGRLPSSYLRRNVASRYLVKAALANAIEDLDCGFMSLFEIGERDGTSTSDHNNGRLFGIYDDPYPGCGPDSSRMSVSTGNREIHGRQVSYCENGDLWIKRVFCPFGPLPYPASEARACIEPSVTVPTLTTEALAYLPPAIVDDVRKVSRVTRTATWHSLPYEAGRYAYTVVNVSDLFDINRLMASARRDSAQNRITLSTLTSTSSTDPSQTDESRADQLDTALGVDNNPQPDGTYKRTQLNIGGQESRFLSLADFNVFASGSLYAPVMKFFGGSTTAIFPDSSSQEAANAMFITDTWFPTTNATANTVFDLAGGHQPFLDFNASSVMEVVGQGGAQNTQDDVGKAFLANLGLGMLCLYDYLDGDSIPMSLSFPTVEAVPMIVGIGAPVAFKPTVTKDSATKPAVVQQGSYKYNVTRTTTRFAVTSLGSVGDKFQVNFAAMFPFKRMMQSQRLNGANYQARGVVKAYLLPKNTDFRCRTMFAGLRPDTASAFDPAAPTYGNGIITLVSEQSVPLNFNNDMAKENDRNWIKDNNDQLKFSFNSSGLNVPIFQQVHEEWVPMLLDPDNPAPQVPAKDGYTLDGLNATKDQVWRPIDVTGNPSLQWGPGTIRGNVDITDPQVAPFDGISLFTPPTDDYGLYVSVWIQVVDNNNKVVDMVPACSSDDDLWNNRSAAGPFQNKAFDGADPYPLLTFMSEYTVKFDPQMDTTCFPAEAAFPDWNALFAVDPRYNFAPEDWFASKNGNAQLKNDWCNALGAGGAGTSKVFGNACLDRYGNRCVRDRDVFMFVSDQEYMQSIGELQFLPWLGDMTGSRSTGTSDSEYSPAFYFNGKSFVSGGRMLDAMGGQVELSRGDNADPNQWRFANEGHFWRTYAAYDATNDQNFEPDPIFSGMTYNGKEVSFVSGQAGFKLNPFSDDQRVQAAAIVNTPYDYYVASTNANQKQAMARKNTLIQNIDVANAKDYSFGPNGSTSVGTQLSKNTIDGIMDAISGDFADMAAKGKSDWAEVWDELMWQEHVPGKTGDGNNTFLDTSVTPESPLHGVDRKFLYSYWRECYANSQQLFLIFVNAEPVSVGGGASGSVASSAQLGGRAVALVWRDPTKPTQGGARKSRPGGQMNMEDFRRDFKSDIPPHRTRVLFYHQFD